MDQELVKRHAVTIISKVLFPCIFYFSAFCILTYPLIGHFSTHFFLHPKFDGLQNVWNIWWVNKAITELHQSPWQTPYLHHPYGITLLGHTLNPFNGFLGVLLLKFLSLIQTYNFIVIFSFIVGGMSTFFLAFNFSKSYWGSMVAGFIFTFSSYHFVHMDGGHLQLVALEWMPLFILFAYRLISKPGIANALLSALLLFFVILCDYYYFFYCVIMFCFLFVWYVLKTRSLFFFKKNYLLALLAFTVMATALIGPMVVSLLLFNKNDPLLGAHSAAFYSADIFSPFIHGDFWRFSEVTRFYWSHLPIKFREYSVHLGLTVVFMLFYVWRKRKKLTEESLGLWYFSIIFFFVMSLGPVLHIGGKTVASIPMPYTLFQNIFPLLKIAGVPIRMMVMVTLSASVIFSIGFKVLFQRSKYRRYLIALFLAVLFIEYLPQPLPSLQIPIPEHVAILRDMPGDDGVFDGVHKKVFALYYQTIHQKPLASGYVSRIPRSVNEKNRQLFLALARKEYERLYHVYKIRYLLLPSSAEINNDQLSVDLLYHDSSVKLYDLGAGA